MKTSLTIIDDFMPNPEEIRKKALEAGFEDFPYMQGVYQGTGLNYKCPELREQIQNVFQRELDFHVSAFRSGGEETKLHVNIHADNSVSDFAGVYYLNLPEQCKGGTAFYTLKEYGWDEMPTEEQLKEKGKNLEWMTSKWTQPDAWELNTVAGMKFNRLIIYPTQYFHSRYPLEGWGTTPENSRLVWVSFWKIKQ